MKLNLPIVQGLQWTLVLLLVSLFSESVAVWLTDNPACETGDFACRFNLAVTPRTILLVSSILSASILVEFLAVGDKHHVPPALWLGGLFVYVINLVFSALNHQVEHSPNGARHHDEQVWIMLVLLLATAVFVFIGRSHMYASQTSHA